MAVHAMRLDESHCGCHCAEELVGRWFGSRRRSCRSTRGRGGRVPVTGALEQPRQTWMRRHDFALSAFEQLPPFGGDSVRVLEVVLEQVAREACVQPVDVRHYYLCSSGVRGAATTRAG